MSNVLEDGTTMSDEPARRPYRLGAGEGRRLWAFGDLMILKATTEETNGRLFVMEQHVPRHRRAPGRHVHAVDDQAWFVIAGHGRFFVGDETLTAGPGDFIHGPHGIHMPSAPTPTTCTSSSSRRLRASRASSSSRASTRQRRLTHLLASSNPRTIPPSRRDRRDRAGTRAPVGASTNPHHCDASGTSHE